MKGIQYLMVGFGGDAPLLRLLSLDSAFWRSPFATWSELEVRRLLLPECDLLEETGDVFRLPDNPPWLLEADGDLLFSLRLLVLEECDLFRTEVLSLSRLLLCLSLLAIRDGSVELSELWNRLSYSLNSSISSSISPSSSSSSSRITTSLEFEAIVMFLIVPK